MSKLAKFGFILGAALVAISAQASTAVCTGEAGDGASIAGASANFIANTITPKCSKSVLMDFDQSAIAVGVCAGSIKGNKVYTGSSDGGAVKETSSSFTAALTQTNVAADTTGCTTK